MPQSEGQEGRIIMGVWGASCGSEGPSGESGVPAGEGGG